MRTLHADQNLNPPFNLNSTLLDQRFNEYFDLENFELIALCKDTDRRLRKLAQVNWKVLKNNLHIIFELDKLCNELFIKKEKKKVKMKDSDQSLTTKIAPDDYFPYFVKNR